MLIPPWWFIVLQSPKPPFCKISEENWICGEIGSVFLGLDELCGNSSLSAHNNVICLSASTDLRREVQVAVGGGEESLQLTVCGLISDLRSVWSSAAGERQPSLSCPQEEQLTEEELKE
ncbi:hypothetical protein JOQ06_012955, partial [Pogonophryne albipinna]